MKTKEDILQGTKSAPSPSLFSSITASLETQSAISFDQITVNQIILIQLKKRVNKSESIWKVVSALDQS